MKMSDVFLVSPPYNMRKDQNNDHAEYYVLASSDMKGMVSEFGDLMKSEHMSMCTAPLYSFPPIKGLCSVKKNSTPVLGKILARPCMILRIAKVWS